MKKICSICKIEKEIDKFGVSQSMKNGFKNFCKECDNNRAKKYYADNREKVLNRTKLYLYNNRTRINLRRREWYKNNSEKEKEKKKILYYADKQKFLNRSKEWHKNNQEKIKKYRRERYLKNKDKVMEYNKRWREKNPEKVKEYRRSIKYIERRRRVEYNRRCREKNIPGHVSKRELESIKNYQQNKCYICEGYIDYSETTHLEHLIPLSREELNPTNNIENLAYSCADCNRKKHDKILEEIGRGNILKKIEERNRLLFSDRSIKNE